MHILNYIDNGMYVTHYSRNFKLKTRKESIYLIYTITIR